MSRRPIYRPQLLSLNTVVKPTLCRSADLEQLHPESPIAIKRNLELDKLDKDLFPTLVTGVRWWPFLSLALECNTEADYKKIFKTSRKLKRQLGLIKSARMGPETKNSFRPYKSMAKNLHESAHGKKLSDFLRRVHFDGNPGFFVNYGKEDKWKNLFLAANGAPAKGYIQAYKAVMKKSQEELGVNSVISHILAAAPDKYNTVLWRGAFSYALIRCLFGGYDKFNNEAYSHDYVMTWKGLLIQIISKPSAVLANGARNPVYLRLLEKIESDESPPPLVSQTKKFRVNNRPVLASMRIPLFHLLYFNPKPAQMERKSWRR